MSNKEQYVAEHFPDVDPGVTPYGTRVLVQLRTVKQKTSGGIVLVEETRDFNKENTIIARVIAHGELAYRNRETGQRWPEGAWCMPGDVVLVTKWGGLRFERPIPDSDEKAKFAVLQDHEIICGIRDGFDQIDQIL